MGHPVLDLVWHCMQLLSASTTTAPTMTTMRMMTSTSMNWISTTRVPLWVVNLGVIVMIAIATMIAYMMIMRMQKKELMNLLGRRAKKCIVSPIFYGKACSVKPWGQLLPMPLLLMLLPVP